MKKVFYKLRKERILPSEKQFTTYGIEVLENGVQTEYISGVSDNKKLVRNMVRICNKNDVEPVHIHDVIEDMTWELNHAQA